MLDDTITPPLAGQPDNAVKELAAVLDAAETCGLIAPAAAADARANIALGNLSDADCPARLNRLLADGPAADRALDALAAAFEPADVIELSAIAPDGGRVSLSGRLGRPDEQAALRAFIGAHIGVRNLYFGVSPRRTELAGTGRQATDRDVAARRMVVLDLDRKDAPPTDPGWAQTAAALRELNPLTVLDSGNGYHVWLGVVDTAPADTAAPALVAAMARIGSDNMADPARIARLPHTPNLPTASKRKRGAVLRLALPEGPAAAPAALRPAPPTVDGLCAALGEIASRLGLPGRGGPANAATPTNTGANVERKTGWAAPSATILRAAVGALPNDAGHFDSREAFVAVCYAIKGAAVAGGCEADGRAAWLDFCGRWNGGGDPDHDARLWDTCRDTHTGWGALMRTLEQVNPAGAEQVRAAAARQAFAQEAAQNVRTLSATPMMSVGPVDPKKIPPRRWLYGRTAIARFISVLVAPGGYGKSALIMAEAVAMATGRELLAGEKPIRPLRVWLHNAEDPAEEQQRRLAATMLHHGVTHADLGGRLFMTSGRDRPLRLARMGRNGAEIVPGVVDFMVDTARALQIDVMVLDPFGAMHGLNENSNDDVNLIMGALREVADRTGAAVILLHHASKMAAGDMAAAGAGASRGASSLVDAVRVARHLVAMSPQEAGRFGVADSERRGYLRVETGKANLSRSEGGRWVRLRSVSLGNADTLYPSDEVGVAERWTPPTAAPGTAHDLARVHTAIAALPSLPRFDQRSPDWAGWLIARALGLDAGGHGQPPKSRTDSQATAYAQVRSMLDGWVRDGGLIRCEERDQKSRKPVACVGIGKPALSIEMDTEGMSAPGGGNP